MSCQVYVPTDRKNHVLSMCSCKHTCQKILTAELLSKCMETELLSKCAETVTSSFVLFAALEGTHSCKTCVCPVQVNVRNNPCVDCVATCCTCAEMVRRFGRLARYTTSIVRTGALASIFFENTHTRIHTHDLWIPMMCGCGKETTCTHGSVALDTEHHHTAQIYHRQVATYRLFRVLPLRPRSLLLVMLASRLVTLLDLWLVPRINPRTPRVIQFLQYFPPFNLLVFFAGFALSGGWRAHGSVALEISVA